MCVFLKRATMSSESSRRQPRCWLRILRTSAVTCPSAHCPCHRAFAFLGACLRPSFPRSSRSLFSSQQLGLSLNVSFSERPSLLSSVQGSSLPGCCTVHCLRDNCRHRLHVCCSLLHVCVLVFVASGTLSSLPTEPSQTPGRVPGQSGYRTHLLFASCCVCYH